MSDYLVKVPQGASDVLKADETTIARYIYYTCLQFNWVTFFKL